ncbi:hypothetical protein SSX86_021183 [Deinandra increscens subsp. villosa]|uniref:Xyloglucan endotransglucosylase/hydrolase n=1 Tax=Deinandra increscens subsp. villosa TaxID=3103831 RepID=A0AAP0GU40_9ASTR
MPESPPDTKTPPFPTVSPPKTRNRHPSSGLLIGPSFSGDHRVSSFICSPPVSNWTSVSHVRAESTATLLRFDATTTDGFLVTTPPLYKHYHFPTNISHNYISFSLSIFFIKRKLTTMASFAMALATISCLLIAAFAGSFNDEMDITFGGERAKILNGGQDLLLSLDQYSGSGFQSKNEYLFGRFDMQLKLVPGNSAGTVTTFYLSSQGAGHDEIDFEFLGNSTGNPYTIHTNVFSQGKGDKEQQFHLWFDPTAAFHTYTIVWNSQRIIFLIDNIPVRVFNNHEAAGVPFPKSQPMRVYASLWNADDWATQGGRVKTDWTNAPFTANYRKFNAYADKVGPNSKSTTSVDDNQTWRTQGIDAAGRNRIRWVQNKHMIYNYCNDYTRFSNGLPVECTRSRFL